MIAKKIEDLMSQSIIIQVASYLERALGNPVIKYMVICSHFTLGLAIARVAHLGVDALL